MIIDANTMVTENLSLYERRKLWETDPEYRKKVIRELEKSQAIVKLPYNIFGELVFKQMGGFNGKKTKV